MKKLIPLLLIALSCQDSKDTVSLLTEESRMIAAKAFEVVAAGDYDAMDQYIAKNYKRHCQATPDIEVNNLNQFKDFIRNDRLSVPDQSLIINHLVAEKNLVAFYATYEGTQTGQMGPFPPSGKKISLDFAGVHRIEDGKIAETWITWDNLAALSQLGHFPPPPPEDNTGLE